MTIQRLALCISLLAVAGTVTVSGQATFLSSDTFVYGANYCSQFSPGQPVLYADAVGACECGTARYPPPSSIVCDGATPNCVSVTSYDLQGQETRTATCTASCGDENCEGLAVDTNVTPSCDGDGPNNTLGLYGTTSCACYDATNSAAIQAGNITPCPVPSNGYPICTIVAMYPGDRNVQGTTVLTCSIACNTGFTLNPSGTGCILSPTSRARAKARRALLKKLDRFTF